MTTLYLSAGNALAVIRERDGGWRAELALEGRPTQCVAADPLRPELVYCGTFGEGLFRSDDAGANWRPAGEGIEFGEVMAVAVSRAERSDGQGVVWAGTEPSALFRSEDGGNSWQECPNLRTIPSSPTWSFPPRPWTHHTRWIEPDPFQPGRIFVGIELGGVMRSLDGGQTWEDRKDGSEFDCHTLRTSLLAPGRVYEAAGGGYAQSDDGGDTWSQREDGLRWHYLWGLAVDPGNPDTIVVSASPSAREAHARARLEGHNPHAHQGPAEATIYRRQGDGPWQEVRAGLPPIEGTPTYVIAAGEPGVFFAAPHQGAIYRSTDAGQSWEDLRVQWPTGYTPQDMRALAAVEL